MINQSESIANLALALSIVQGKMSHAVKDSANPFFKSKYADLVARIEETKDLSKDDEAALRAAIEDYKRSASF